MLYLTHSLYAVGISLLFGPIIHFCGFSNINYWLTLVILCVFGKEGAKWPDCDHRNWNSVKEKTPFYWICNKIIVATGGKHRSRHTHTLMVCIIFLILGVVIPILLTKFDIMQYLDSQLIMICCSGFGAGWLSHLIADAFNGSGIYLSLFSKKKFSFVSSIQKLPIFRSIKYNTGGDWEELCQTIAKKFNFLIILLVTLFGIFYI